MVAHTHTHTHSTPPPHTPPHTHLPTYPTHPPPHTRRLICFMVFNAFPDYNDVDSWEGTIKSLGRACCLGDMFSGSAAVGGRCGGSGRAWVAGAAAVGAGSAAVGGRCGSAALRRSAGRGLAQAPSSAALCRQLPRPPLLLDAAAGFVWCEPIKKGPFLCLTSPGCPSAMQRAHGVARGGQVAQPAVWRHRHGPHRWGFGALGWGE